MLYITIYGDEEKSREEIGKIPGLLSDKTIDRRSINMEELFTIFKQAQEAGNSYQMILIDISSKTAAETEALPAAQRASSDAVILSGPKSSQLFAKLNELKSDALKKAISPNKLKAEAISKESPENSQDRFSFRIHKGGPVSFRGDEIYYLEARGHEIELYNTRGPSLTISGKLVEEEKRLIPRGFIKIHRSYLVNSAYIKQVEGPDLTLTSGVTLRISKRYQKYVHTKYREYIYQGTAL